MGRWVCGYDVTSDRQRRRIARELERSGIRVQKSVFAVEASRQRIDRLVRRLGALIDPATDVVTCWPLADDRVQGTIVAPASAAPTVAKAVVID